MLKIAVFTNNPNAQDFYEKMAGLKEESLKEGSLSLLHVFRSRIFPEMDSNLMTGEYNIFFLPELSDYDAFVLDLYWNSGDGFLDSALGKDLLSQIRKQKKPAVSIGNYLDAFVNITADADSSMRQLMDHLSLVHQCRKYWFFADVWKDASVRKRMEACFQYLDQCGFPCTRQLLHKEYRSTLQSLSDGFEKLLCKSGGLPDAIVCSDDFVALGIMCAALKKGLRIPEDCRVVGFGNWKEGMSTIPSLTSLAFDRKEYGRKCMAILRDLRKGRQVQEEEYMLPCRMEIRSSCGCVRECGSELAQNAFQEVFESYERVEFGNHIERLESDLLECNTLNQIGRCFYKSCLFPDCCALYIVLDRDFSSYKADDAYLNLRTSSISRDNSHFPIHGFPKSMKIVFSYENQVTVTKDRPIRSLFPAFEAGDSPQDFLFIPIHFRQYTVGYFVVQSAVPLLEKPFLVRTIRALCITIENLYTKRILSKYNKVLTDLSTRDGLTGFYNRLGYERIACRLFEEKKRSGEDLSILFIDMDGLKIMNDTYGHEAGDFALKAITTAIDRHKVRDQLNVRMGGDEFLLIMDRLPDEDVEKLLKEIEEEIPLTEEAAKLPYSPGISVGYIHTDMTCPKNLDEYVREADEYMYQVKVKKGTARK